MDFELDFVDNYIESGYGQVHYKHHAGSGPKIVFIHGFASSLRTWKRLASYLPMSLDIYLIDLLGHGKSEAPEIDYTVKVQLEVLSKLISSNGIKNPYLFGHSYGGWIAALYAQAHTDISGLVLEDSIGIEGFIEGREKSNPDYKKKLYIEAISMNPRDNVIKSSINAMNANAELTKKSLGAISKPTLVIWGGSDSIVGLKYGEMFADCIPGSKLEIIKGAEHTPHYTAPEEVSKRLLGFLGLSVHML